MSPRVALIVCTLEIDVHLSFFSRVICIVAQSSMRGGKHSGQASPTAFDTFSNCAHQRVVMSFDYLFSMISCSTSLRARIVRVHRALFALLLSFHAVTGLFFGLRAIRVQDTLWPCTIVCAFPSRHHRVVQCHVYCRIRLAFTTHGSGTKCCGRWVRRHNTHILCSPM
jgi:hypothetical protein